MKKSQILSSLIMCGVILLLIIQFTIAWYTGNEENPSVTGSQMQATQGGGIKVAVTEHGEDILQLAQNRQFVSIGLEELNNISNGKFAPGAYGDAVFYVTPLSANITECQIVPRITISLPSGEEKDEGEGEAEPTEQPQATPSVSEELQTIVNSHIQFFSDKEMTKPVNEENPMLQPLEWETDKGVETTVTVYWKWHYEYPFTAEENEMTQEEKKLKTDRYDEEDTQIGNAIETMNFQFELAPLT